MSWREKFLLWSGPGLFAGITLGDWLALLRQERFAISPSYWWRAWVITMGSVGNALVRSREEAAHGREIAAVQVPPPLFVLGIWRSGTTHLHNLFAVDPRFATPNWYQVSYPHTYLSTEATASRLGGFFVPERRIQDNVRFGFGLPAEEEFSLCVTTRLSPMLSWVFPRNAHHFDRYLTFRDVLEDEAEAWRCALRDVVKKLAWKHGKPLVLKSPGHTARIRHLLKIFPNARFVHIHRNPYAVIQSASHMTSAVIEYFRLQRDELDVWGRSIRQYREVYDAYFEDRGRIPPGQLHEIRFEDLESDPIGQMRGCYEALGLPAFDDVQDAMQQYLGTVAGYRKNQYPPLDEPRRQTIAHECRRCFEAWSYPL